MKQVFKSLLFLSLISLPFFAKSQNCEVLNGVQLKKMLNELGYTIRDLETAPGKEKYEVKHAKGGFDIPVSYEISPSTNYIWLTVVLGKAKSDTSRNHFNLLKQNGIVQPCQFFITETGSLKLGLAIDNRGVTNALLRRLTESVCTNIIDTKEYWNIK